MKAGSGVAVQSWKIGNVTITRLEEQLGFASRPPDQYLDGFERDLLARHIHWLVPHHYSPEHDRLITSIHSWLIRTPHRTICSIVAPATIRIDPDFRAFIV